MIFCLLLFLVPFSLMLSSLIKKIINYILKLSKICKWNNVRIGLQLLLPQIKENIFIILSITYIVVFTLVGYNFQRLLAVNSINYYNKSYLTNIQIMPTDSMLYEEGLNYAGNLMN